MNEVTTTKKRTLLDLVQSLSVLDDTEGAIVDENLRVEFEKEVADELLALGSKIDSYADLITYFLQRAEAAKAEAAIQKSHTVERLIRREKRARADAERLMQMAVYVIRTLGRDDKGKYRKLEGLNAALSVAKVADSCEVYDESLVPDDYKDATISHKMTAREWQEMTSVKIIEKGEAPKLRFNLFKVDYSIDKTRLLAALKEPCAECKGSGELDAFDEFIPCPKCNGKGTKLIPGARLLSEKLRLVVS
jgi:hypothetical protein